MSERSPETMSIPVADLVTFFHEICDDVDEHRKALQESIDRTPGAERSEAGIYSRGKLAGERHGLQALRAFIVANSSDLDAELELRAVD